MRTKEQQKKYNETKRMKKKRFVVEIPYSEIDIINHIESKKNKSGYLLQLIKSDLDKENKNDQEDSLQ